MLKLIQVEFLKLRRRKLIWIMLLAAFVMPFFALLYFNYFGKTGVDPMLFYKWSAFGYTSFIILPFILGILCTILMHDENRYDMMKQLWIVPVSKMGYFFSKFVIVLVYAICFMLITAVASVLLGKRFFLTGKMLRDSSFGGACDPADLGGCCIAKGIYLACLYFIGLYIFWLFYHVSQYVSTSLIRYSCDHSKGWGNTGACIDAGGSRSLGTSLFLCLGCCCGNTCKDYIKKKVRQKDENTNMGGM